MKYFKLPDLGEGLQEAEIVEWLIKPGDSIQTDQIIVHLETAKAIVEVPSPQAGTVAHLFGSPGDMIHIGEPLLEYANQVDDDQGAIVGDISHTTTKDNQLQHEHFFIGNPPPATHTPPAISASALALAKRLGVDINTVKPTSTDRHSINSQDIEIAAQQNQQLGQSYALKGVRRAMAINMEKSRDQVVHVSLFDDVDIHEWQTGEDTTLRLIQAISTACLAEPSLNSWYEGSQRSLRTLTPVDIGIAVDTPDGLFVPVMRNTQQRDKSDLKKGLELLKTSVKNRSIPAAELLNPTITLSNFGTIAGRYGTPIVIPPTVAIVGAGVKELKVVVHQGEICARHYLPLSLSFDHRCITGGEAARFLAALKTALTQSL